MSLSFVFLFASFLLQPVEPYGVTVVNSCPFDITVGTEQAGTDGSFCLSQNQQRDWTTPGTYNDAAPKPRIWADRGCGSGRVEDCRSQNYCSLAEFNFQEYGDSTYRGYDWYDISLVDGYNLPVTMIPYQQMGGNCYTVSCNFNLNQCPSGEAIYGSVGLVGCVAVNRDDGNSAYAQAIRSNCQNVYSYSHDDQNGQRACTQGSQGIVIKFC